MKHEIKLPQTGLVLEGGGMRGTFTAGVLDMFLEKNIRFPYVIGVSAGACNALSYISEQKERTRIINIDMLRKYKYIGFKQYLKHGSWIDLDLLFNVFPYEKVPYDFDKAFANPCLFEMVTTNCITGKPEYLSETKDKDRLIAICKASSSLPFISKPVFVDKIPMLDGGLCDSIPIDRALFKGYQSNVVVLTREKGYRKAAKNYHFPGFVYKNYPAIKRCLKERAEQYNRTLDKIEKLEDEHKIVVIRPLSDLKIGRTEQDEYKLRALYQDGLEAARLFCNKYELIY